MELTFWGVRGTIPSPGPATVRYGGNTACVTVRLANGGLLILDCGTGARALGHALLAGAFGRGEGEAALLLSLAHWDHIQGFPFFGPLYVPGNKFVVYGASKPAPLEAVLEGQMAAQYFPVQTIRNLAATLELRPIADGASFTVAGARVTARGSRPGPAGALAFRIEADGRALAYAGHAGYGEEGPTDAAIALYRDADVLVHDSTFTPEDKRRHPQRGLASLDDAIAAASRARAKRLVLFHYDQDYTDSDVDDLLVRGRRIAGDRGATIELVAAAEGQTLVV